MDGVIDGILFLFLACSSSASMTIADRRIPRAIDKDLDLCSREIKREGERDEKKGRKRCNATISSLRWESFSILPGSRKKERKEERIKRRIFVRMHTLNQIFGSNGHSLSFSLRLRRKQLFCREGRLSVSQQRLTIFSDAPSIKIFVEILDNLFLMRSVIAIIYIYKNSGRNRDLLMIVFSAIRIFPCSIFILS